MNDNKGKAKIDQRHHASSGDQQDESLEPSFVSRVAASAKGLTRDSLSTPKGEDASDTLASALLNSGKTSSRSNPSSSRPLGEGSAYSQLSGIPSTRLKNNESTSHFRSNQTQDHVKRAENEFSDFLDGIDNFQASSSTAMQRNADEFETVWRERTKSHVGPAVSRTVAEQERLDGEDVLAILNAPSTTEGFDLPEDGNEQHDWGLDEQQLAQIRTFTKEMFPSSNPQKTKTNNSLNLMEPMDPTSSILMSGSAELSKEWWEQWEGVLTRYADEVWGGLLPLVKEARKGIEDVKKDDPVIEVPDAVRRLQSILGHLQQQ